MIEAGLAIAPLARCSVPGHLVQLRRAKGYRRCVNSKSSLPAVQPLRDRRVIFSLNRF